jgi:hypothetical protein
MPSLGLGVRFGTFGRKYSFNVGCGRKRLSFKKMFSNGSAAFHGGVS